jgi:uncharacterized membrane protein
LREIPSQIPPVPITAYGTIVALVGSLESVDRRDGVEVVMDKIIVFLLIGLVGWWIGNLVGQVAQQQLFDADPSGVDMIFGIVGSSFSSYFFLYAGGTR